MPQDNSVKNASGCLDLTAHDAIDNIDKEHERYKKLLGAIFRICELAGFRVEERIVVRDLRTGTIWR